MNIKEDILKIIGEAISALGHGYIEQIDPLLDKLKEKSSTLSDKIQEDILDFIIQIEFQKDYDYQHLITKEIQEAADKLIKDLKS